MTLQERLREIASKGVSVWGDIQIEAADRIDADEALMRECLDALDAVAGKGKLCNAALEKLRKRLEQK